MYKKLKTIFIIIILLISILVILLFNQKKNDENKSNYEVNYIENKKEDKECILEKESMYRNVYLGKGIYNQLCNYKNVFIEDYTNIKDSSLVENIYLMSKIDKDFSLEVTKKYINKDFTKELTQLGLLQTFTVLERIYGYNETQIRDTFGIELKHNYRYDKNLSFEKIFLGINILDKDYDREKLEMEDLNLLDLVANFEPDSIIGPMNINVGFKNPYESIVNKEGKEKFINIIKKILINDKKMNGQYFWGIFTFLNDNNKIDKDFLNIIKTMLLEKSIDKNSDRAYNDGFNENIHIIEKYDKEFVSTVLNNFKQKNKK